MLDKEKVSVVALLISVIMIIIQICPELKENLVAHVQSFTPHQVCSYASNARRQSFRAHNVYKDTMV